MEKSSNDRNIKLVDICFISSIPYTIYFYRNLLEQLKKQKIIFGVASSGEPDLFDIKNKYRCDVFPVRITRNITPFKDMIAVLKLTYYFRKRRYQIVHAHTPKGGLVGMISAFLACIPVRVYTIHGLPLETARGAKRKLLWLAELVSCRFATQILAVSPSLRDLVIKEKLCSPDEIKVLGDGTACGIDTKKFELGEENKAKGREIRKSLNIADDDIVIGFVGRLAFDKGIETLVKSFYCVQRRFRDAHLLLVGPFDKSRETFDKDFMDMIESNNNIHCVGFKKNTVPYYAAMDLFVMPSRREGFGMTLIEASAMELPVIGTRIVGCVDAVEDGVTGLFVEVDNEDQLSMAIMKLIDNPQLRKTLGQKGNKRIERLFDASRLVEEHLKLYSYLCEDIENR
jgi:glycosyltransferase involved in cell wall biosynthesis